MILKLTMPANSGAPNGNDKKMNYKRNPNGSDDSSDNSTTSVDLKKRPNQPINESKKPKRVKPSPRVAITDPDLALRDRLTTEEGQLEENPYYSTEQARAAAKREYNRRNAARARIRSKHMIVELQQRCTTLTQTVENLLEENSALKEELATYRGSGSSESSRTQITGTPSNSASGNSTTSDPSLQHSQVYPRLTTQAQFTGNESGGANGNASASLPTTAAAASLPTPPSNQLPSPLSNFMAEAAGISQGTGHANMSPRPVLPTAAMNPMNSLGAAQRTLGERLMTNHSDQLIQMLLLRGMSGNSSSNNAPVAPQPENPSLEDYIRGLLNQNQGQRKHPPDC